MAMLRRCGLGAAMAAGAWTLLACGAGGSAREGEASAAGEHGAGHMDKRFVDAERWAEHFDDPARDEWQKPEEVVHHMDISPGHTVADIGAGTGYFLPYLAAATGETGQVVALDVEPTMVAHMRERIADAGMEHVEARLAEPDDSGLACCSVDRILVVNTWHHIPERRAYSAKLRKALKIGGAVYVVDFAPDSPRGPPEQHRLAPAQVMDELRAGGLDPEVLDESLPHQYIVVGHKR